jgi:phage portal protein BeeE
MAFVVTSGQLTAIERAVSPPIIQSVRIASSYRTYAELWRGQPELRTVVDFLSRNIAQLPIHVFERVSDVDRRRLADHPLAVLLERPNYSTTRYRLLSALMHDLCIYDNAFLLKVRDAGQPVMLRRIRPSRIVPDGADWLEATGYTVQGNKGTLEVGAEDMVHFRGYDAQDDRVGCSPIESLKHILAEEWAAKPGGTVSATSGRRSGPATALPLAARRSLKTAWTGSPPPSAPGTLNTSAAVS